MKATEKNIISKMFHLCFTSIKKAALKTPLSLVGVTGFEPVTLCL